MITISSVILFVTLFIYSVQCNEWPSSEFKAKYDPTTKKCKAEIGIGDDSLDQIRIGKFPSDDTKFKNYLLCIFKDLELINYTYHDFEYWKIMTMASADMKKPVFEMGRGCLQIKGEDYAKASLDFIHCLYNANPSKFHFLF